MGNSLWERVHEKELLGKGWWETDGMGVCKHVFDVADSLGSLKGTQRLFIDRYLLGL